MKWGNLTMRKETLMVIPEIQGEQKETFNKLVELSQVKKQIAAVETQKQNTLNMMGRISDDFEVVLERIVAKGLTTGTIAQLSDDDINNLLVTEDGTPIKLNLPMDSDKQEMDFKRDFLDMLLNNSEHFTKIDEAVVELEKLTEDYNEEVRNIFAEVNGDIASFVRNTLKDEQAAEGEDSPRAKSIQLVLDAMDHAINLQPIIDLYTGLDPRNTIDDFMRRGTEHMTKFHKNCNKNGIGVDFSRFASIEATFFEDPKLHVYPNMFIFQVVKMYAKKKEFSRLDAIFLTQLAVNLQTLLFDPRRGSVLTEEQTVKRDELLASIKRALELIIPAN